MPRKATNPQNLTTPKKGEVRNPNGRPKGSLDKSTILKKWLELETKTDNALTGQAEKLTQIEQVLISLIGKGKQGDVQAVKEIFDRYFGKEKETIEATVTNNIPIKVPLEIKDVDE